VDRVHQQEHARSQGQGRTDQAPAERRGDEDAHQGGGDQHETGGRHGRDQDPEHAQAGARAEAGPEQGVAP
jgi:hypothetical protein